MRRLFSGVATIAGLLFVVLAITHSNNVVTTELFDPEDPDFFQADPVYSASPARDNSARVLYSVDSNDDDFPRAVLSPKPATVISPGAALSVLGGRTDDDAVGHNENGPHFVKGEMLSSTRGMSPELADAYRGSLAGKSRLLKELLEQKRESSANSGRRYPTQLQQNWNKQASFAPPEKNVEESDEAREAREIRRRWIRDEQQQRQDRKIYRDRRILYEEPGRPENIAHHKGAKRAASDLLKAHAEAEKKRRREIAKLKREIREEKEEKHDQQEERDQSSSSSNNEFDENSHARARSNHHEPQRSTHRKQGFSFFDEDKSHIAAMRAVDEALDAHDNQDQQDEEARDKVSEKLHSKADKLREVGEQEQTESYSAREKAKKEEETARHSIKRAKELQEKAARILERADKKKGDSNADESDDVHHLESKVHESAITRIRQALQKDENMERKDELSMAGEAVRAQSLLAHHKDISLAIQAKMASLKKHIQKDARDIKMDRATLENLASPGVASTQKLDISPTTHHGAAYDAELRAKHLYKKSSMLRNYAKNLREKAKSETFAQKTVLLAAKCLEQQSEALQNDEGPHDVDPQKLYAMSLKTCGLV